MFDGRLHPAHSTFAENPNEKIHYTHLLSETSDTRGSVCDGPCGGHFV